MTEFINTIVRSWPQLTIAAGVVAGICGFMKLLIEIKRLNLQVKELENKIRDQENRIYIPTQEEIKKFTKITEKLEQKIEEKGLQMLKVTSAESDRANDELLHRIESLLSRYSELAKDEYYRQRRKEYEAKLSEMRNHFSPTQLQGKIINLIKERDSIEIRLSEVNRSFPDTSCLEAKSALDGLEEIELLSAFSWGGKPYDKGYRVTSWGASYLTQSQR